MYIHYIHVYMGIIYMYIHIYIYIYCIYIYIYMYIYICLVTAVTQVSHYVSQNADLEIEIGSAI